LCGLRVELAAERECAVHAGSVFANPNRQNGPYACFPGTLKDFGTVVVL